LKRKNEIAKEGGNSGKKREKKTRKKKRDCKRKTRLAYAT
jgi:hypothetical protein